MKVINHLTDLHLILGKHKHFIITNHAKLGFPSKSNAISFTATLDNIISKEVASTLNTLLANLETRSAQLISNPSLTTLEAYKASVRDIILFITRKSLRVKEIYTKDVRVLKVIESIDDELERLSAIILSGEVEKLNLISHLDNIKGLIINLVG